MPYAYHKNLPRYVSIQSGFLPAGWGRDFCGFCRRPQVCHRLDVLHASPFDRLELDGHADQRPQKASLALTGEDHLAVEVAADPGQPARLSAARGEVEEARLQPLAPQREQPPGLGKAAFLPPGEQPAQGEKPLDRILRAVPGAKGGA